MIYFLLYLMCCSGLFSQNDSKSLEKIASYNNLQATHKILIINASSISQAVISDFKTELLNWHEKVTNITYDQEHVRLIVKHNGLLHPREMTDVLLKYNISNDKIISYH